MQYTAFSWLVPALSLASLAAAQSNIDPAHKVAWAENIGWTNWRDANGGADGVAVSDTYLGGFVWGENVGWINAGDGSPGDGVHYGNTDGSDAGVNIDPGTGELFGLAWGENVGWINLDDSTHYVGVLAGPTPLAWRSVREHWIQWIGPVPLPIALDAAATGTAVTCEPRREGVQRIEVDFDVDVSGLISGTIVAEDLTPGGTIAATGQYTINGGATLVIEFKFPNPGWPGSPPEFFGLPDETCYRIDLAGNIAVLGGDTDCEFRVLGGDLNGLTLPYGDGKTDLTDMAHVKSMAVTGAPLLDPQGHPIPENIRFDVNTDGVISLTDMALVKSLKGGAAGCP